MDNKRLKRLLSLLLNETSYTPARMLAAELNLSTKTIRNLIKDSSTLLQNIGATIEIKSGYGFKLTITDHPKFETFMFDRNEKLPDNSDERVDYILQKLLANGYHKLAQFEKSLYIARNTLSSDIRKLENILSSYNLQIVRKVRHGIKLDGTENDIRQLLTEKTAVPPEMQTQVSQYMQIVLDRHKFNVSDYAYQGLLLYICVAIQRISQNFNLSENLHIYEEMHNRQEFTIASELAALLCENFTISFSNAEIAYLAANFAGKKMRNNNNKITPRMNIIIEEMLEEVYRAFNINLSNDLELKISLCQHCTALEIRVRYNLKVHNPLLNEMRQQHSLAYQMAIQACSVVAKHFGKPVDDSEIGYIAFNFGLALERRNSTINKKNILLVCSTGTGSAKLLEYKYRNEFGSQIDNLSTCSVAELATADFSQIDYIISTVKLNDDFPVPHLQVQYFLTESDHCAIRTMLTGDAKALDYYNRNLFISQLQAENRTEVIKKMCNHIAKYVEIPPKFYESVMQRDAAASTEFGNMVAMPHPSELLTATTFVCVAILEKPIIWKEKPVQVVFLVSVQTQQNRDLQPFYNLTAKFLLSEESINKLIKTPDFDSLTKLLLNC
ncbi:MAG: PRD domain-containing protein [Firmicutes bacterium]|nr:PRD domain-containing protein [Bacillota bacterium]